MPSSLEADVRASLAVAVNNSTALDAGLEELRLAVAERDWDAIEPIREKLLAAVDGYVDAFVAAARRVEYEREGCGRSRR